jgi:hypothetical protein
MLRDEKKGLESANDELLYYIADSHDEYDRLFAENMLGFNNYE